nr:hypothetical protein [Nitrosomonas nitrosa]
MSIAFGWLFRRESPLRLLAQERINHRELLLSFWAQQAWWLQGSADEVGRDYKPMPQFGYLIVEEIARLVVEMPSADGPGLWKPILGIGPQGHYSISHFFTCFFFAARHVESGSAFGERWRLIVRFMLEDSQWNAGKPWYYKERLERAALGFGASDQLNGISNAAEMIGGMWDLFETWAKRSLGHDEDNVAGLCGFLSADAGKQLRLSGLQWIDAAMRSDSDVGKWHRKRTSDAFVEFLAVVVSEDVGKLSLDRQARQALLNLAAHAVSRQLDGALAIQERVRRIF